MKKIKKILLVIISIIFIIIVASITKNVIKKNNKEMKDNRNVSDTTVVEETGDSVKFKKEYEQLNGTIREKDGHIYNDIKISNVNPIKYIDLHELVNILSNQNAIVLLSSATCPYCRASIPSLLKAAKDLNINTIYYYDITSENNEEDIDDMMQELNEYGIVNKNEKGKNVWKIPQLLNIKNRKIVSSANGAMYELNNEQSKYDELTEKQESDIYNIYRQVLSY